MNLLVHLSVLSFIVYVFLGLYAFLLEPKQKLNQLFLLLCLSFALWALSYSFVLCAWSTSVYLFWSKLSVLGWGAFSSIILHISLTLTNSRLLQKPGFLPLIYLPGFAVIFYELFLYGSTASNWYSVLDKLYFYFNALYYVSFCIISLYLIKRWGDNQNSKRERLQAAWIVGSGTLTLLLGFLVQTFLPMLGIHAIPLISHILIIILAFGLWVSISRYRLLKVTSMLASEEIISLIKDLLVLTDSKGNITQVNKRFQEVLGYYNTDLLGKHISSITDYTTNEIASTRDESLALQYMLDCESTGEDSGFEIECISSSGEAVPLSFTVSAMKDRLDEVIGYVFIAQDIRQTKQLRNEIMQRKKVEQELLFTSLHDSLTGLLNRTSFELDLVKYFNYSNLGLLVIDIDGLKLVNDTLGHLKGDELIKQAADLLSDTLSKDCSIYRIGGDEFAVIMQYVNPCDVEVICHSIKSAAEIHNYSTSKLALYFSVGFSYRTDARKSIYELFSEADSMMYSDKLTASNNQNFSLINNILSLLDNPSYVTSDNKKRIIALVQRANQVLEID